MSDKYRVARAFGLSACIGLMSACGAPIQPAPGGADPGAATDPDVGTPSPSPNPGPAGPIDSIAPSVVSTSPIDGAVGITQDEKIVVTFSEPMDTLKTEAAYSSALLPAEKVSFSWNGAGDQLTITPAAPLEYAAGDALVPATEYVVSFGTGAVDKAGNPLAAPVDVAFSTLRRVTLMAAKVKELTGWVSAGGASGISSVLIGDGKITNTQYKGFATFSMDSMPAEFVALEAVTLIAAQANLFGTPDLDLGVLSVHHVFYEALDASAFIAEPIAGATVQKMNGGERRSDVTEIFQDDFDNRVVRQDLTQYRYLYSIATDGDGFNDYLVLATPQLEIVYLAE